MHLPQAGDEELARRIDRFDAVRYGNLTTVSDFQNLAVGNYHNLVWHNQPSPDIHDRHMLENQRRCNIIRRLVTVRAREQKNRASQ